MLPTRMWRLRRCIALRQCLSGARVHAQVPCTPPGPIIIRVTNAGGSYIRLVLLNVRPPLHVSA